MFRLSAESVHLDLTKYNSAESVFCGGGVFPDLPNREEAIP